MEDVIGKFETIQKMGTTKEMKMIGKVPKKALTIKMPSMPKVPTEQSSFDNPLGTKFTVFALAFNALGLASLTIGGVSIGGSIVAAEAVLGSSLVCLSAYLFRSIIGNRRKKN
jgi:hypothetical protein